MKEKLKKTKVILEILLVTLSVVSCFRAGTTIELMGIGTSVVITATALMIVSLLVRDNAKGVD